MIDGLKAKDEQRVRKPHNNPNGTSGQVLRTLGDGDTEWANVGAPADGQVAAVVNDWMDEHLIPVDESVVIDDSLSIPGAAADAKAAGDIKAYCESKGYMNFLVDENGHLIYEFTKNNDDIDFELEGGRLIAIWS